MNKIANISRRDWLAGATAATVWGGLAQPAAKCAAKPTKPKSVAGVVTAYEKGLHADVLLGKILEGWKQDAQEGRVIDVSEYPEVICTGLHINFDSTHPVLTYLNEEKYGAHVEAYELGGSRVVIAGSGEIDPDSGDAKNSFAAIVDTTAPTQEAVIHVVSHPWGGEEVHENVVDENEYLLTRKLIEELSTSSS